MDMSWAAATGVELESFEDAKAALYAIDTWRQLQGWPPELVRRFIDAFEDMEAAMVEGQHHRQARMERTIRWPSKEAG